MQCPTCKTPLTIAERQGVEIDFCPSCRGVWLDRGELDKILDRTVTTTPSLAARDDGTSSRGRSRYDDDDDDDDWRHDEQAGSARPAYGRRRTSWLSDLFDFG